MLERDSLEEFRDPETYDVEVENFDEDRPLIEQWARELGGPLLDLACGTGRVALRLAAQGYQVTGVDIVPEMIAHARRKAAERAVSVEWVVADARAFQLHRQFPFIFMVCMRFNFFGREPTWKGCWLVSGSTCNRRAVFSLKRAIPRRAISRKSAMQSRQRTRCLMAGNWWLLRSNTTIR
jgi:SAM-dependent methyltransferase